MYYEQNIDRLKNIDINDSYENIKKFCINKYIKNLCSHENFNKDYKILSYMYSSNLSDIFSPILINDFLLSEKDFYQQFKYNYPSCKQYVNALTQDYNSPIFYIQSTDNNLQISLYKKNIHIFCELKPVLGEDFPTVERKMREQKEHTKCDCDCVCVFILIIQTFNASSTTKEQLKLRFNSHNIRVIFMNDLCPDFICADHYHFLPHSLHLL